MALRKTGLEFQAKGTQQFIRSTEAVNKATERVEATFARMSKLRVRVGDTLAELRGKTVTDLIPKAATERLSTFTKGIGELTGRLGFLPPSIQGAVGGLGQLSGALGGVAGGLSLAAAGVAVFGAVLVGLGMRGAAMPGVIQAFDVATQRAGIYSQTLLGDLREASRGTIADLQLMRTANLALAGASEGLAQALGPGKGLAGLMNIARAQARATGQDVNYLFDSLVMGVKRGTPLLIDNTGLVLKVSDANERFAQSLGKAVGALTAEEKQIALLNATLEAGRVAVETYGRGALQASERIAIIRTTITNTLDKLAVSVQPLFNYILAIGQTFVSAVAWPLQNLVIPVIYELANALFGPLTAAWERTAGIISGVFQPVAQLIHRWLVVLVGAIRLFGRAWNWVLETVSKILGPVAGLLKKYLVEPVSKALDPTEFAKRAGYAFGALAQGILWAANTYIFPAVILIAEFIADFLMGFSPPKRGPLSRIDEGGANVMRAWLQGFMGVSLQPVKDVTAAVNAELGKIGRFSENKVQARVAQLDAALQPFIDRLDIAKAKMAALIEPLKGVQDALQKKLARQLERFTKGEVDAESVRAMDRQNAALSERIQSAEDMTVEAEYQLALKRSEQAVERALLAIQARRVKKTEDVTAATEKLSSATGKVADDTEKAAKGGGGTDEDVPAGGGFMPTMTGDPIGDWLGVSDEEIDQMWGEISGAFAEGFEDIAGDDLARAKENWGKLDTQLKRIGKSKPFKELQHIVGSIFGTGEDSLWGKIESFGNSVSTFFSETLPGYVDAFSMDNLTTTIAGVIGWPSGSVWGFLSNFQVWWTNFWAYPDGTLANLLGSFSLENIKEKFREMFGLDTGGIRNILNGFKTKVNVNFKTDGLLSSIFGAFSLENIKETFREMFGLDTGGIRNILNGFKTKVNIHFKTDGLLSNIFGAFSLENIKETFNSVFDWVADGGIGKTIDSFGEQIATFFKDGAGGTLFDILAKVGGFLWNLVAAPVGFLANAFLAGLTDLVNGMIDIVNAAARAWNRLPFGGGLEVGEIEKITAPTVTLTAPVPAAREGGFFGPGLATVHGGEVLMGAASKFAVFPKRWVRAMDLLARSLSTPARTVTTPGGGANTISNTTHQTLTVNFNGGDNRQNLRMRLSEARALL